MSRSTIEEQDTPSTSPQFSKTYRIDRYHPGKEEILHPVKGPIPLALPQLLDAERGHSRNVSAAETSMKNDKTPDFDEHQSKPSHVEEWPGHLRFADPGTSQPTTEQVSVTAHTAEHDEHHTKPRASVVRSTIRDLLSATKRRVSGKSSQNKPVTDEAQLVTVGDAEASIIDLDSVEASQLPELKPNIAQDNSILSGDGKSSCLHHHISAHILTK